MNDRSRPDWWRTYFDTDFQRIYAPLLPIADTLEAVEAVFELTGMATGTRILDLACGWGRHSVEFWRAGATVTGMDRSFDLLRRGRDDPDGSQVGWVCADLRALPFRRCFDVVACLFSSLGYFDAEDDDLRVLQQVGTVLSEDGLLVIETIHRDAVVRDYTERDWWQSEDGAVVFVEREFDAIEGVTREWLRWRDADGTLGEKFHSARIRSATEWKRLLNSAGFEVIAWHGGWHAEPFDHASERLVVIATLAR
jgi:SAM-dependent methyltransferase